MPMKGIEKIIARIEGDAQTQIDAALDKGRAEAAEVERKFRAEAEALRSALTAKAEKAAQEREERLVSAAQMEGRKTVLAARQQMVEKAYEAALDRLCSLPQKEYVDILAALLLRASASGREEVIFSKADCQQAGQEAVAKANAAGKHLTLSKETRPLRGGFILKNGNVETNCAFETLVRLEKGQSAAQVAKRLFPEG